MFNTAFNDQWLVGLHFKSNEAASLSWSEIKQMNPSKLQDIFHSSKVVMCKRNVAGQFYVARGLREMIHFTIGPTGKTHLSAFLNRFNIKHYEVKGDDNDQERPPWFQVLSRSKKNTRNTDFLDEVDMQLKAIGKVLIPELLKVSYTKCTR